MKPTLPVLALIATFSVASITFATPQTFDFKDPKGVNHASFNLDAPLESISGSASGISGTVTIDPENPAATKGQIIVETASLHVGNPLMKEHLHGEQWLDSAKNPEIKFTLAKIRDLKTEGNVTTATATGSFSLKGVEKEITVPITFTLLPGKLSSRVPNTEGDLAVIRSEFTIKRSDYGINPSAPADKVADEIKITLAIAGSSPKS